MSDSDDDQPTNNNQAELKLLVQKRGQIKSKLTRFKSYLDSFTHRDNLTQLKIRLSKLEECYSEFEKTQDSIEIIDSSDNQLAERESFENQYFSLCAQAQDTIGFNTTSDPANSLINNNSSISLIAQPPQHTPQVRLPSINLPTFSGKYEDWLSFSDTFQSLIHSNESLNDVQKLHYLKSALSNEASHLVQSLELTSTNYSVAWELLEKRYRNERLIVQKHIKSMFDLPSVERETACNLRQLLDGVSKHMRALAALKQPTEHWDALVVHLITSKLNQTTYKDWEMYIEPNKLPTFSQLTEFLEKRCHILENSSSFRNHNKSVITSPFKPAKQTCFIGSSESTACRYCNGNHVIFKCDKMLKDPHAERTKRLRDLGLCFNCLRPGHVITECRSSGCRKCKGKHNTVLHFSPRKSDSNVQKPSPSVENAREPQNTSLEQTSNEPTSQTCTSTSNYGSPTLVLLSTAAVDVVSPSGLATRCRVLLDNGSQSCFITEKIVQQLNLPKTKAHVHISGLNEASVDVSGITQATIKSCTSNFTTSLSFLVVPKITGNIPSTNIDINQLQIPKNITLADPNFSKTGKIDLLLGQEIFLDLLCIGQIKVPKNPTLQKTKLGWIIGGKISELAEHKNNNLCHLSTEERVDKQLKSFWELEEPTHTIHLTSKEKYCEEHFKENTVRNTEGRYVVKMPLQSDVSNLGESKEKAVKRFLQVEKRLQSDEHLRNEYTKFMKEYEDLRHMEKCDSSNYCNSAEKEYYLPHHPVINTASTTTKVRVVFDASAKTSSGISLNDLQLVGPTIQRDIVSLLLSYRIHNVVLSADVEKMYRQVLIDKSQRNLLRIVWRPEPSQPLETYQLNTITYGTSSAAYLATRTLLQLAEDERDKYPKAASVVQNDFYVDDLMTGVSTVEEAVQLQTELTDLLATGGFNLRKWKSNSKEVLKHLPEHLVEIKPQQFPHEEDKTTKTLGLWWDNETDDFIFKYNPVMRENPCHVTKRTMLSDIAKLFDPLGIVSPILVRAKLLLQELWKLKLNWDESVPSHIFTAWRQFLTCLQDLSEIRVPRQTTLQSTEGTYELFGFADSSELAYGGVVYLRHTDSKGNVKVSLLCSKSRIAPLHSTSLPRLELCAALLLAELVQHVEKALPIVINETYYWTDSTVALTWIQNEPARWTTFVANRVAKIQALTKDNTWNHVRSEENPADLLSRGTSTQIIKKSKLWWNGPSWLIEQKSNWPLADQKLNGDDLMPEQKHSSHVVINKPTQLNSVLNELLKRYSSYDKILRVLAWTLRLKHNLTQKDNRKKEKTLQLEEIYEAEKILIRYVQEESFSEDKRNLSKGLICTSSKLSSLDPFLDEDEIIRVGGRIKESSLNYDQKHPILLPKNHRLTDIIAQKEHLRQLHCGPQALLYSIRERFWPINGRDLTRRITRKCIRCFKAKPKVEVQKMGNLPDTRVNPARPFLHSGVDFCGPVYTKASKQRGLKSIKSYIAVFICKATKAVHLELVSDLTTEAFLAALRRFISRRGICATMSSDNGKTFVGANRQLQELKRFFELEHQNITYELLKEGIKWEFNPPYSPHMGGLWEAAVKSLKHHLIRVIGNASLTFEELSTLLNQIEAVLNSRPLTPISNHPSDLTVLTPGHFLTGAPLKIIQEPSLKHIKESRLSRWQRLQNLLQHFWTRWSQEYLNNLQRRSKWTSSSSSLKLGDLVLLKEDNVPPLEWPMGRVTVLHPGKDNLIRTVTIKTANRSLQRTIHKVCKLPIEE